MSKQSELVCVTGASGSIGSWVVRLLLDRGYSINATVKDLKDENETKHLEALEGAESRLRLFQIDLLDYDSIAAAISGCAGVFHLASPCTVDKVHEPEKEILDPAIKGTINVLTAAKEAGVRRVVVTSSISAIVPSPHWPADKVRDEDCWTDLDYCKHKELWYPMSKTLAEKAAWEFFKEKGLDVVVVNPGTVMGSIISPRLNASMLMFLRLLQEDENETKHLEALAGAESRLRLFQIDLLDYDSIAAAIRGCAGVFHLASPCTVDKVHEPEKEILDPAIKGTINVLTAAKEAGVRRVVVTSSISAIVPSPHWPADKVRDEDCWTDLDYCKHKELWYPMSKTLAEKAAWEFFKEKGLDVVVVNPGTVMGSIISPRLNASMLMFLRLLQGCTETYENFFMGPVHFKDVALAHILVYENKSASGRHLCVEAISHYGDFVAKVAELYPEYKVPSLPKDTQPGLLRANGASKKLIDLGLQFIPVEQIIKDSVESLKSKGYIS